MQRTLVRGSKQKKIKGIVGVLGLGTAAEHLAASRIRELIKVCMYMLGGEGAYERNK